MIFTPKHYTKKIMKIMVQRRRGKPKKKWMDFVDCALTADRSQWKNNMYSLYFME